MMKTLFSATIAGCLALTSVAHASTAYDGSWDLVFVTQRGACDPTYNFARQRRQRNSHASKSGAVQRLCSALGCGSRFSDRPGQVRLWFGQTRKEFRPWYVEWLFGTRRLLRLLDRTAELAHPRPSSDCSARSKQRAYQRAHVSALPSLSNSPDRSNFCGYHVARKSDHTFRDRFFLTSRCTRHAAS
jgi:hypothetical protein